MKESLLNLVDLPKMMPEQIVTKFLTEHPDVRIIVVQWVDICGVTRSRLVPVSTFVDLVKSGGHINGAPLNMTMPTTEAILPEMFAYFTDDGTIVPDVSSLRVAAHDASGIGNTAIVYADIAWLGLDARMNLKKAVARAEAEYGMKFLFGFEIELVFLKRDSLDGAGPARTGIEHFATLRSEIWPVVNEIVLALSEAGIQVQQLIKEYGGSQWEIALPPLPPVESVDAYVYTRDLVKNIAHKHGIEATLFPAPFTSEEKGDKSGEHIHMSVTPVGEAPADWDPETVMAGVLSHIPELVAVGASQIDSYMRIGPSKMGAGGYLGWGTNHRDMPIRRVSANHWEVRCHDGTANPYAMVAGLIAASTDRKPLTMPDVKSEYMPLSTGLTSRPGKRRANTRARIHQVVFRRRTRRGRTNSTTACNSARGTGRVREEEGVGG
jgi:glutamine synthetase